MFHTLSSLFELEKYSFTPLRFTPVSKKEALKTEGEISMK